MRQTAFGIGMCLRDSDGQFVCARTSWDPTLSSVSEGEEALGLNHSLRWLTNLGVEDIQIELDYKVVVDRPRNHKENLTELGMVVIKSRELLRNFPSYHVSFIKRQANLVAHTLVRASISHASFQDFEHVPLCIQNLINNEMLRAYSLKKIIVIYNIII